VFGSDPKEKYHEDEGKLELNLLAGFMQTRKFHNRHFAIFLARLFEGLFIARYQSVERLANHFGHP